MVELFFIGFTLLYFIFIDLLRYITWVSGESTIWRLYILSFELERESISIVTNQNSQREILNHKTNSIKCILIISTLPHYFLSSSQI